MKAELSHSGSIQRKGWGRQPAVMISITPENELEKAILRMAYSGKRKVYIYESGNAEIQVIMPRGTNE